MRRFRILLAIMLLGLVLGVVLGRPYLLEWGRQRLAAELGEAMGMPVSIAAAELSFFPPKAEVGNVVIGKPAAVSLERGSVRLLASRSLARQRPVLVVDGDGLSVDAVHFAREPALPSDGEGGGAIPLPLDLEAINLSNVQARLPLASEALEVTIPVFSGRVVSAARAADLDISVRVPGVTLRRRDRHLAIERLSTDATLGEGGLRVHMAEIESEDLNVSLGRATDDSGQPLSFQMSLQQLGFFDEALADVAGRTRFAGSLDGELLEGRVEGTLVVEDARLLGRELGNLKTRVQRTGPTLRFSELAWSAEAGRVTGAGVVGFEDQPTVNAELSLQDVDVDGLLSKVGVPFDSANQVDARVRVQGTVAPLDLKMDAGGRLRTGSTAASKAAGTLEAVASVQGNAGAVRVDLVQGDSNRVRSELGWEGTAMRGLLDAQVGDLGLVGEIGPAVFRELQPKGELQLALEFTQADGKPRFQGTTQGRNVEIAGVPLAALRGAFLVAEDTLELRDLGVDTADGTGSASGRVALGGTGSNDWRAELRGVEIDLLVRALRVAGVTSLPLSEGHLSGAAHTRGPWSDLRLQAQLHAQNCRVADEPFAGVRVQADAHLPRWKATVEATHRSDETMTVEAASADGNTVSVSLHSTPIALEDVHLLDGHGITGRLRVAGELDGTMDAPGGTLNVDVSGLSVGGQELGEVVFRGSGAAGRWEVTGAALRDSLQVRSAFALTDATYELLAHWKDSALAVGGLDTPVHVTSSGRLRLNGRFDNVMRSSGGARIEHLEISRGAERMSVAAPVEAEIDAGRVRVSPFRLDVPGGQATLGGEFAAPAELRVDVEGAVGLAVLELVLPAVSAARGQVQLRTRIAHASDGGWELRGDASVRDAVVDFGLPVALTDGRADLRFDRSRIEIGAASATMGSGRVDLAGTVDVERGPRLSWMLEDVAVSPDRGIEARLSGTGEVGGTWGRLEIGGHVSVLEALYDRNVEMTDVLPALVRRFRPPAPEEEPTLVVLLDLRVHAPDRVFIDNNLAQIELRADLRLRGEARQPSITGTVRLLGGELTLRGNTFTVLAGTIDFRDPFRLNPVLDVTAEADIDSGEDVYTITMHVTGTGEEPRVQFSADDPNLSQNDVISLVAFGKTMTQLQRSAGGTAAADVLAFVPTGTVEEDVRGLIGVDRFEVGASRASDSNAIEPMLTIGKNLSERLRGFVTTTFGVEQRRIVQLEYRWSRRVSVVGSWESETESQAGAFGGDVRFRYEFRRLPFSLLRSDDEAAAADDAD